MQNRIIGNIKSILGSDLLVMVNSAYSSNCAELAAELTVHSHGLLQLCIFLLIFNIIMTLYFIVVIIYSRSIVACTTTAVP